MRYSPIDIVACPHCHADLVCWTHAELSAPVSAGPDVMEKYGILEKGMELEDVVGYAAGTALGGVEQHFVARARRQELGAALDYAFVRAHSVVEGNLFTLVKGGAPGAIGAPGMKKTGGAAGVRRRLWPPTKRRIKAALLRVGLD